MDMSTLLYLKWIPNKYCITHGTLLNSKWQSGSEGSLGEVNTCICMPEFLYCSPESITTLLIGDTPIQNKNVQENKWWCNCSKTERKKGGIFWHDRNGCCHL